MKKVYSYIIAPNVRKPIGHFHYSVILLQLPESCCVYVFSRLLDLFFFAVHGIKKFEFEKEKEMNSGSCSIMRPS